MEIDNTCTKCFPGNDEIKISYYYHINYKLYKPILFINYPKYIRASKNIMLKIPQIQTVICIFLYIVKFLGLFAYYQTLTRLYFTSEFLYYYHINIITDFFNLKNLSIPNTGSSSGDNFLIL